MDAYSIDFLKSMLKANFCGVRAIGRNTWEITTNEDRGIADYDHSLLAEKQSLKQSTDKIIKLKNKLRKGKRGQYV